jgi:glutathione S-transferase
MLTLHIFRRSPPLANAGPFCMKLETWLRLADLPHRITWADDMAAAPKGKAPWLTLPDGRTLGDSALAIAHLTAAHGVRLDDGLEPREAALAHALAVMLEERTYFAIAYNRWAIDVNWAVVRDAYFGDVPPAQRAAVTDPIRAEMLQALHLQGLGRHRPEEVDALAARDVDALAVALGERPFVTGDRPRSVDATAFAFAANLVHDLVPSAAGARARGHANLVAYVARMQALVFPDLAA